MTNEDKTETTKTEIKASLDPETTKLIASLIQKTEEAISKMEKRETSEAMKKEEEEKAKKKAEEEETKKKESLKLEEMVSTLIKQEIAKSEKKEFPPKDPKEPDEDDKSSKKKETIGAKVQPEKVITSDAKPVNMVEAMWADVRKAAKDFGIIS